MRELSITGFIALAFGLGSYYATKQFGAFAWANVLAGAFALSIAAFLGLSRLRGGSGPEARRLVARHAVVLVLVLAGSVALVALADRARLQVDWTLERKYELAPATITSLAALDDLEATLFLDTDDPRIRGTRLLLSLMAQHGTLEVRERDLGESPEEEDAWGVPGSNSVVFVAGDHFELVDRPTEGAVYEALSRLRQRQTRRLLLLAQGEGEGDVQRTGDSDYSGLGAQLVTEGFQLREFVTAAADEIPGEAAAVVVIGAERPWRPESVEALERYLRSGGRLVVFLEPGVESGLEGLLERWGFLTGEGVLVDPASGPMDGVAPGLAPVAYSYATHPVTRGLDSRRMTVFRGVAPIRIRKPRFEDDVRGVVFASGRSWIHPDAGVLSSREAPVRPPDVRTDYHPIVAVGRYPGEAGETRIVVSGDSDFTSNGYLRALYNLDLVLNSVHWVVGQEALVTTRPKAGGTVVQFPLPIQNTLRALYGVGLLIPELLLVAGALVWLRQRGG